MTMEIDRHQYNADPSSSSNSMAPTQPVESPIKSKSKWAAEEDALIRELREGGREWEDISKCCPGQSAISCRLHYQNYLERRSVWDEERKNKLARLYERFTTEMWTKVAEEMGDPFPLVTPYEGTEDSSGPANEIIAIEEEQPAIELMVIEEEQSRPQRSHKSPQFLFHVSAIEVFLAPTIIVSGTMSQQSDPWKPVFVSLYGTWLILLTLGLYLDLRLLEHMRFARRSLWHLGSCLAMLSVLTSVLQIDSENLPKWVPFIIDCGLGASCGIQMLPADSIKILFSRLIEVLASICGCIQITFNRPSQ